MLPFPPCDALYLYNTTFPNRKLSFLPEIHDRLLPIIGCTGNAMSEDIAEFELAGATKVLSKPVSRQVLKEIVNKYTRVAPPSEGRRQGDGERV